jgi:ACS family sodium-dependent inorganic phosphate cotransporter-like MFS transporter 5
MTDKPSQHKWIPSKETLFIEQSLLTTKNDAVTSIPWKAIWTSPKVYGICLAHFCHNWTFITLLTNTPTYLKTVLGYNLAANGVVSALPFAAQWALILVGGQIGAFQDEVEDVLANGARNYNL